MVMRYCVQFENHAIEIALIRVKVMSYSYLNSALDINQLTLDEDENPDI